MNREDLINIFKGARETNAQYVFVVIKLPDLEIPEMIINRRENFESKEKYYIETYDENLIHKFNNDIYIQGLSYGELEELKNIY